MLTASRIGLPRAAAPTGSRTTGQIRHSERWILPGRIAFTDASAARIGALSDSRATRRMARAAGREEPPTRYCRITYFHPAAPPGSRVKYGLAWINGSLREFVETANWR